MIELVGIGAVDNRNYQTAATPAVPAGVLPGDLLLCLSVARSTANNVLSSSWTQLSVADTGGFFVLASYKFAAGGAAAPTITPANMTSGQTHASRVIALRGVNPAAPFGPVSTAAQIDSQTNVGPIAAPAGALPASGAVIVLGSRLGGWTSADVLTGDGLSWIEAWDETTALANVLGWAMNYAIWSGAALTLTSKTFAITGGAASSVIGQMWTLSAALPPTPGAQGMAMSSMPFPPFP